MLRSLITAPFGRVASGQSVSDDEVARHAEIEHAIRLQLRAPKRHVDGWPVARLAGDLLALTIAVLMASVATDGAGLVWLLGSPALMLAALVLTEISQPRLRTLAGEEMRRAVTVSAVATMAVALVALVSGAGPGRVQETVEQGLIAALGLGVARVSIAVAQAAARRRRGPARRTLIIGAGRVGRLTAARLVAEPTLGLKPVGFLDKEPLEDGLVGPPLPVFGASWDLERTLEEQDVETVVVAFSTAPNHVPLAMVRRCWELGVSVILIPRLFEVQGVRTVSEHLGGLPLVTLNPADPRGWELRARYLIDRFAASLAVLFLAPLLLGIALAVRMKMGGPVLFRQPRMGRDGHVFDMLKFRTMWGEARQTGEHDASWAASAMSNGSPKGNGSAASTNGTGNGSAAHGNGNVDGSVGSRDGNGGSPAPLAVGNLPGVDRRTPLGCFLRRWSLDELPQLLNVVQGDMALIGPRPERARYASEFEKAVYRYRDRARIKPGITGWAQVNGLRGQTSLADRVEWDNFYIENWSPWLDIKILFFTIAKALRTPD